MRSNLFKVTVSISSLGTLMTGMLISCYAVATDHEKYLLAEFEKNKKSHTEYRSRENCQNFYSEARSFADVFYGSRASNLLQLLFDGFNKEELIRLNQNIFSYIYSDQCALGCEQIDHSEVEMIVHPADPEKNSSCQHFSLIEQAPRQVDSPLFEDARCDVAHTKLSEWIEDVIMVKNTEGEAIEKLAGPECSKYITYKVFTLKKKNQCLLHTRLYVRFGPLKSNFMYKSGARVKHQWVCI